MNTPDKRFKRALRFVLAVGLIGVVAARAGQQPQTAPNAKAQFTPLIRSVEGPDLFRGYCASCHGLDARGSGPAAPALKSKVPNLTLLAINNGGQFPTARVRQTIMGDKSVVAHGSREMPIWGPIFHQVESDVDWGNVRLENLVKYLESMQTTTVSNSSAGAELYRQHCAACHGNDLKGGGTAPLPFKAPPDLTTLARRHGGKFPEAYISDVLRNGVVLRSHGSAQMPIWGPDFATDRTGEPSAESRIASLRDYIEAAQTK